MSNSKRSENGTLRREEESRLLYNSKGGSKAQISRAGALGSTREQDIAGRYTVLSQCAFHPSEKITNFCTNKECLLPLCPKCVKIHTDEHIKMGIFGQFDTIEESFRLADDGLRYSFEKLSELERLMADIKQAYDSKLSQEKRRLREAKNYFVEQIETIFDCYQKALTLTQNQENRQFLEEMASSDALLNHLSQHFQKCHKKITNSLTVMEGIINYFSQSEEIERVELAEQKMQRLFPQTVSILYHSGQLQRLESLVKRYIDCGKRNDSVWNQYKRLNGKADSPEKPKQFTKNQIRLSPIKVQDEKPKKKDEPYRQTSAGGNTKISELAGLQSNLSKFKSPLDNFTLLNRKKQT